MNLIYKTLFFKLPTVFTNFCCCYCCFLSNGMFFLKLKYQPLSEGQCPVPNSMPLLKELCISECHLPSHVSKSYSFLQRRRIILSHLSSCSLFFTL